MPTSEEVAILNGMEDEMTNRLGLDQNAALFARVTCRGTRDLIYRVRDPVVADGVLQERLSREAPIREWDFRMEQDAGWVLAQPEIELAVRAPGQP